VEWGISGLKQKWKKIMKHFNSIKPNYNNLFKTSIILINFLHKHHLNFTYDVIGDHIDNLVDYGLGWRLVTSLTFI
jgi:hypothetical protein